MYQIALSNINQEYDTDCWHASLSMVLGHHRVGARLGSTATYLKQRTGAKEGLNKGFVSSGRETLSLGVVTRQYSPPTAQPFGDPHIDEGELIAVAGQDGFVGIMMHDGLDGSAYTAKDLERLLMNHGPIACGLKNTSTGGGHMVVIKGVFDDGTVLCNDPDPSGLFSNIFRPISQGTNGEDAMASLSDILEHLNLFFVYCGTDSKWCGNLGRWKCDAKTIGW